MKKTFISGSILALLMVFSGDVSAFTIFNYATLYSNHTYYADSGVEEYYMLADTGTNNGTYPVYVQNVPNASGDIMLIYFPGWRSLYPDFYIFSKGLPVSQGYPLPGTNWKNISYQFYIDENGNSQLDTGETSESYSITGSIVKLGLVQNVKIFGNTHPTIEWDAVPSAGQYHVRLFPVVDGNPSTDSCFFDVVKSGDGSGRYSYTYNGDLFSQYETLAIGIEARDYQDGKLVNRSRYVVKYLPLQRKGNSMPGIPLLLLDN